MPQMMPLSWLTLLTFFSIMFLLYNLTNYFSHIPMPMKPLMKKNIIMKMLNWKW
uniref:ATP synthase F0 subunit 8 n=1 Tax=Protagonista lugubris TaxID=1844480 RepID=A0A2P1H9D3_9NEOP|nr:ATP synthase F0 subunit 8 [Protagonista lugubris]